MAQPPKRDPLFELVESMFWELGKLRERVVTLELDNKKLRRMVQVEVRAGKRQRKRKKRKQANIETMEKWCKEKLI